MNYSIIFFSLKYVCAATTVVVAPVVVTSRDSRKTLFSFE